MWHFFFWSVHSWDICFNTQNVPLSITIFFKHTIFPPSDLGVPPLQYGHTIPPYACYCSMLRYDARNQISACFFIPDPFMPVCHVLCRPRFIADIPCSCDLHDGEYSGITISILPCSLCSLLSAPCHSRLLPTMPWSLHSITFRIILNILPHPAPD